MKTLNYVVVVYLMLAIGCQHNNEEPPTPYETADGARGGIMYDKFWSAEADYDQNNANIGTLNTYSNFFRCKQCHAWDGLGSDGSYNGRAASTSRPNVTTLNIYDLSQQYTDQQLYDALKKTNSRRDISYDLSTYDPVSNNTEGDKMPNLTQVLTDAQLWDLAKFLNEGMFDVSNLYDADYTGAYPVGNAAYSNIGLDGDAVSGNVYYSANCAGCHGDEGQAIQLEGDLGVGGFARSKPYEVQHKVKYGQLGTNMAGEFEATIGEMKDLYKALADESNFPDNYSAEVSYSGDMQPFFDTKCVSCHGSNVPNLESPGSYDNIINGGYVNTTDPASSTLYTVLFGFMGNNVSDSEKDMVLRWIEQGALDN